MAPIEESFCEIITIAELLSPILVVDYCHPQNLSVSARTRYRMAKKNAAWGEATKRKINSGLINFVFVFIGLMRTRATPNVEYFGDNDKINYLTVDS